MVVCKYFEVSYSINLVVKVVEIFRYVVLIVTVLLYVQFIVSVRSRYNRIPTLFLNLYYTLILVFVMYSVITGLVINQLNTISLVGVSLLVVILISIIQSNSTLNKTLNSRFKLFEKYLLILLFLPVVGAYDYLYLENGVSTNLIYLMLQNNNILILNTILYVFLIIVLIIRLLLSVKWNRINYVLPLIFVVFHVTISIVTAIIIITKTDAQLNWINIIYIIITYLAFVVVLLPSRIIRTFIKRRAIRE